MSLPRGCCNLAHSAVTQPKPGRAVPCCAQHRIKQATSRTELLAVAELCAQEFSSTKLSERLAKSGRLSVAVFVVDLIERAMAEQAAQEMLRRFSELEDRKLAGERDQHRAALRQVNLLNDINGARNVGKQRYADDLELLLSETRESARRKRIRWRFKRQSMVFLAQSPQNRGVGIRERQLIEGDAAVGGDAVVGCCTIVLKVLDAALPPPFPTRQPARLYIGNLVVLEAFRRCGCGSALLQAAEKLGWRWRHREIWLHVDENNTPAVEMYLKSGYSVIRRERDPMMPLQQRLLMKKTLPQRTAASAVAPKSSEVTPLEASIQEASAQDSKVFVWDRNEP